MKRFIALGAICLLMSRLEELLKVGMLEQLVLSIYFDVRGSLKCDS